MLLNVKYLFLAFKHYNSTTTRDRQKSIEHLKPATKTTSINTNQKNTAEKKIEN